MVVDVGDIHGRYFETYVLQVVLADIDHLGDESVLVRHHLLGRHGGDRVAQMSFDDVTGDLRQVVPVGCEVEDSRHRVRPSSVIARYRE